MVVLEYRELKSFAVEGETGGRCDARRKLRGGVVVMRYSAASRFTGPAAAKYASRYKKPV